MGRKSIHGILNLVVFVFLLIVFIPNTGLCSCYPPNYVDYTQGGQIYVGWPHSWGHNDPYLLIQNTSGGTFKNVTVSFPYVQWRNNPYEGWPFIDRWIRVCQGTPSERSIEVKYVRVGNPEFTIPDISCRQYDFTRIQDIEPGATVTVPYPQIEGVTLLYESVEYRLWLSDAWCCKRFNPQGNCEEGYWDELESIYYELTPVSGCHWDTIWVTGDNILTGGVFGCESFSPIFDSFVYDAGESYTIWYYKALEIKITPSVKKAHPNEKFTLTVEFNNATEETYEDVVLVAYLPEHTTYVDGSASYIGFTLPEYRSDPPRIEWNLGTIKPWNKGTGVFQVQVDSCIPDGTKDVIAKARIVVSGNLHKEALADPVTIETLKLTKEVQEKQAYKNDLLHYTLRIKNLCDCGSPNFILEDPIHSAVNFVSVDKEGYELDDGIIRWQGVSLGAGGEEEIHMIWQVKEDLEFQPPDVTNGFAARFASGKEVFSNSCSTFIGEGLRVILELKNYNEGGNPSEAVYDTNVAILNGRVLVNPWPENPDEFFSGLTIEPEGKPIVQYYNQFGRSIDVLISELINTGLLREEDIALPTIQINPADGTLQLQGGSTDIPIKLRDEVNNITIRVRDKDGHYDEATVVAKSDFHRYLLESMNLLDKLKAREVKEFYDTQMGLFKDWYAAFERTSDMGEARRFTEAAFRMTLAEKFAYEASKLGWDMIEKSIEAEKDFLTIGDAYDVAGLFLFDKVAKALGKTKPIAQGREALIKGLTPTGNAIRDFLFDKIAVKAPNWVLMSDLAHTLARPLSEIAVDKTGEAMANTIQYGFKKAALEKWVEGLEKASIGAALKLFSHSKDFYLWALSYSLLSAQSDALFWNGEHDQAKNNFQTAMSKIINIRDSFTKYTIGFDIKAAVWGALGDAGDVTSLIPAGWTQWAGKLETALGVVGRNTTRGQQAIMTNSFMNFLLKVTKRGMDSVINSSLILPPQDPTDLPEDTITPLLQQLEVKVRDGNLFEIDPLLQSLAVEFEKFNAWEKEVRAKGTYALPQAGMEFEGIARAYDRFLNAGLVANIERAALTAWALTYELSPPQENKESFLGAIISAIDSQAELMAAAPAIVSFLNTSQISSLAIITKIETPIRLEVGNPFTINVHVKNVGEENAQGIKLKMVLPDGFSSLDNPERNLGDLAPGAEATVAYNVLPTEYVFIPRGVIFYLNGESGGFIQHYEDTHVMLSTEKASAEAIIGNGGGSLSTPGNEVALSVPASAVQGNTTFILLPVSYIMNPGEGLINVGGYYDIAALDQTGNPVESFAKPLEVTLRYQESDLNGVNKATLQIWYLDEPSSTWVPVPSFNDPNSNTVIGYTNHLSTFALFPGNSGVDSDGDGMPDWWEVKYGLNPNNGSDAAGDLDRDNLTNVAEYLSGTDPFNPDTDGDGIIDGYIQTVMDLRAFRSSSSSISLTFTSPNHEASGYAASYDLRYSKEMITEENFSSATEAWGEQLPLPAGSQESITVRGLEGNTTYCFGLKSMARGGRVSPLSNVVCAKTSGLPDWVRHPDPVISNGEAGAFDEGGVLHPAVIFDRTDPDYPDGVYKMWYSGISGSAPEDRQRIGYAISSDGVNWTKVPGSGIGGSVIDLGEVNGFIESRLNTPAVIKDETDPDPNARYKLWYYQYGGWGEVGSNALVYCTSPDGVNWTKRAAVMHRCSYECVGGCKAGCEEGRFDWGNAYFPSILKDESEPDPSVRYKMWYTGYRAGEYSIGYATSPDGIHWTRVNGPNPDGSVLMKEALGTGDFDEKRVWTPSVVKIGDTYIMFYSGSGSRSLSPTGTGVGGEVRTIGFATSKDGINWEKIPGTGTGGSSLDLGPSGRFDEEGVLTPSVIWDGSIFRMWYGGTSRDGGRRIGYAESRPGMEYLFTVQYAEKQEIGADGGEVRITDPQSPVVGASVVIPAGVLETSVTFTIGEFSEELPPLPEGVNGIGVPVHFGPEGMDFSPYAVTIGIPYREEDLTAAGITDPEFLEVYVFDSVKEQWERVDSPREVDKVNKMIWIEVTHFSIYRLGFSAVKANPVADAGRPYQGWTGIPITFDASGSYDPDGTIVLYEWDWDNDGVFDEGSTSPLTTHTWNSAYKGNVVLRVTDNDGLTGLDSAWVEVQVALRRISGGAYFFPENNIIYRASFSMDVTGPSSPSGWFKYYYTRTRMNFVSTAITSVSVSGNTAVISGTGTVNGAGGYTFTATVVNGSPDIFTIVIKKSDGSTYYSAGPKNISGGDLVFK